MRGKVNTWESNSSLRARLWAVFNVILFILSVFIQGAKLPSESVTVILNLCTKRGGSQRGYAAEPCEHTVRRNASGGRGNYHCMCNHKSRTITHTIRHLLSPGFLFCHSAWGAHRQLRLELRRRHDWLDQLLWSVKGQVFHQGGCVAWWCLYQVCSEGLSVCFADAPCKGRTAVVSVIARLHTWHKHTVVSLKNYLPACTSRAPVRTLILHKRLITLDTHRRDFCRVKTSLFG